VKPCRYPEARLALFIEGDLSASQARAAERHLRACAACRTAAAELRAGLDALKALARPEFNAADLDGLQQRVSDGLHAIEASPNRTVRFERAVIGGLHRRRALAAIPAAALVIWKLTAPLSPRVQEPLASAAVATAVNGTTVTLPAAPVLGPIAPPVRALDAARVPPAIPTKSVADAPQPKASPSDDRSVERQQPLLVKLFTDDPNVVIYWMVDSTGAADASSSY
jgi:anti-sigma factor RsiW